MTSNVELLPPAGWHTEDPLTDKSATTYSPVIRDRWLARGWPVWPLYTADQVLANVEANTEALRSQVAQLEEANRQLHAHGTDLYAKNEALWADACAPER